MDSADRKNFAAKADALTKQYDGYSPLPGYHVNGALTLGENIADNSGVAIAYKAYKISLGGKPAPVLDGLTGDQRFYMGFARCGAARCAKPDRFFDYPKFLEETTHYEEVAAEARELLKKGAPESEVKLAELQDLHGPKNLFRNTRNRMSASTFFFSKENSARLSVRK